MSETMTVLALVNGMIGGIILVLPLLANQTTTYLIAPVTIISAFISFYSCLLCLRHLGQHRDLDESILFHFKNNNTYKKAYDILIGVSVFIILILYFSLICDQWEGMFGENPTISVINFFVLFPLIYFMKKYQIGTKLLGYGILSIIAYIFFLLWMTITTQKTQHINHQQPISFANLAAALAQGFAIQQIFIPILKKKTSLTSNYKTLTIVYIIGTAIYTYIAFFGAYCVRNRIPTIQNYETISDYFNERSWELTCLQIIYLVHLYSVFPQYLLIGKNRIFSAFQIQSNNKYHFIVYLSVLSVCLLVKLLKISIMLIIELNGSVVSFFFVYLVPITIHVKCLYFSKHQIQTLTEEKIQQLEEKKNNIDEQDKNINFPAQQSQKKNDSQQIQNTVSKSSLCGINYKSHIIQKIEIILLVFCLTFGLFTLVRGLINVFN